MTGDDGLSPETERLKPSILSWRSGTLESERCGTDIPTGPGVGAIRIGENHEVPNDVGWLADVAGPAVRTECFNPRLLGWLHVT